MIIIIVILALFILFILPVACRKSRVFIVYQEPFVFEDSKTKFIQVCYSKKEAEVWKQLFDTGEIKEMNVV